MKKFTGTIQTTPATQAPLPTAVTPAVPEIATQSLVNLFPSMKKADGTPLVDYNQSIALTSIKFSTGEPVLSLNHRYFVYEIVNMLDSLDYDVVYNFLSADWAKVFGNVHDIRKKILFETPLLDSARDKLQMDMEIYRDRLDISIGAINCPKCSSKETMSKERQNRAADEPVSIYCSCLQCNYKWRAQ